jgi:hypothetical protein
MQYVSEAFEFEVAIDAAVVATQTENGATCDLQGFQGVTALIDVGLWTDGTITIHFEDANDADQDDTPDSWSDAAAADVFVGKAGAAGAVSGSTIVIDSATNEDNTQYILEYTGLARYARISADVSGGTTGLADVIVWYLKGPAGLQPVA